MWQGKWETVTRRTFVKGTAAGFAVLDGKKRARARLLHDFDSHRYRRGDRRAGIGGARRLRWWWKKLTDGNSLYKTNIGFLSDKLSNRFVSRVRIRR